MICLPNMQVLTSYFQHLAFLASVFFSSFPGAEGEGACCLLGVTPRSPGFLAGQGWWRPPWDVIVLRCLGMPRWSLASGASGLVLGSW